MNVKIFCEKEDVYNWLQFSFKLSSLKLTSITHVKLPFDRLDNDQASGKTQKLALIVVTQSLFNKLIKSLLESQLEPVPILVLTNSFEPIKSPEQLELTLDTIPLNILTINLLEHSVRALVRDFGLAQKLIKLAHFDPLTSAANRLLFEDRFTESLKRCKRLKENMSLLYFDLDDFKMVNDQYGHDVGDALLIKFVSLIKSVIRDSDTLARMGGDEFALLLLNTSQTDLVTICDKIITKLSQQQDILGHSIEIKSSIGAVLVTKEKLNKANQKDILKLADNAVYQAKTQLGSYVEYVLC